MCSLAINIATFADLLKTVDFNAMATSVGITLPEVHGIDKEIDPNIRPEKRVIEPIITSEAKGISS